MITYSASFSAVSVTTAQDLFELTAPASGMVELLECYIAQSSDAGDAQSEMARIEINRYATSGSGGSTTTPRPHLPGGPASGSTVEINNTTLGGTATRLFADAFNVQAGWSYRAIPEARFYAIAGGRLAITLPLAPADSLTMSGTITWREYA